MLGNLGADLAYHVHAAEAARVVEELANDLPFAGPVLTQEEHSQAVFDQKMVKLLKRFPIPGTTPLY